MSPRVVINAIALQLQSSDLQYRSNESRVPMTNRKKLKVKVKSRSVEFDISIHLPQKVHYHGRCGV